MVRRLPESRIFSSLPPRIDSGTSSADFRCIYHKERPSDPGAFRAVRMTLAYKAKRQDG
jgi:hypothetical protein